MTRKGKPKTNYRKQKALESLLSGNNKAMAALSAGVEPSTLSRWLREDEAFRAKLESLSDLALKNAAIRLKSTLDQSVDVLQNTMVDDKVNPAVRLRAADLALAHVVKLLEVADILERVEHLETITRITENREES